VRAEAEQLGDPLDGPRGVQDHGPRGLLVQPLGQVGQQERRALRADQVRDPVAEPGQPQRVPSRTAADVGDQRRRGGQKPQYELGGPGELEPPVTLAQPAAFLAASVVRAQFGLVRILHDPSR
jgi:hypothetical protein